MQPAGVLWQESQVTGALHVGNVKLQPGRYMLDVVISRT
jgi:hypothetical protein